MNQTVVLSGAAFANMVRGGAANLNKNRTAVNELNVFPVPDGDTGDNMYMTIGSGAAVDFDEDSTLSDVASEIAGNMLLGARGNSGVILSRIFAGIAKGFEGCSVADIDTVTRALKCGVDEAYQAVSAPVEGTILTVCRESVDYANSLSDSTSSIEQYFENLTSEAENSLMRTPEKLDILAKAGVVDSGGAGLLFITEGMKNAIGSEVEFEGKTGEGKLNLDAFGEDSTLEFGYCTEFLLRLQSAKVDVEHFDGKEISDFLNGIGNSVVCFKDGSIIKAHVHTENPGDVLNEMRKYGEFLTVKIENMSLQHNESESERLSSMMSGSVRKKYAGVVCASGKGICDIFTSLGADAIVDGGQSMNPSAEDFIRAFDKVNADTIFVFPNNKNVILAANQAASLYDKSDVRVIPTKTIGEGYGAYSMLDTTSDDVDAIVNELTEIARETVTGTVCGASRDSDMDNLSIKKGDYIGIANGRIYTDCKKCTDCVLSLADSLEAGGHDVLILLCGENALAEDADMLYKKLEESYRRTEIIMLNGGMPVYDYILILE